MTRPAEAGDAAAIARLVSQLGREVEEAAALEFLRGGGEVLIASLLGQVAGVAVLGWLRRGPGLPLEAWLTGLVTDAPLRHRGIARALLEAATRRARQAGAEGLWVACPLERDDARAFWAGAGFEPRAIVFGSSAR